MFNSTKIRLTLWYAGVLALTLTVFAGLTYFLIAYNLKNQADKNLIEIAAVFQNSAESEYEETVKIVEAAQEDDAVRDAANEFGFKDYQIFAFSTGNFLISETKIVDNDAQISSVDAVNFLKSSSSNQKNYFDFENANKSFRIFYFPLKLNDKEYQLIVTHSLEDQNELMRRFRNIFLIFIPLILLAASFGGYFLARKSFAPISEMAAKAEAITAKNLHERLPVRNKLDELGVLAGRFNELLARLNDSFDRQRRFMADASHEIRTPVSIVRGEAEVTLGREHRSEAEYRESLEIIQSEAERMTFIIEDLFVLARVDAGQQPLQKTPLYLDEILSEAIRSFRTIAEKKELIFEVDVLTEMPLTGDANLLQRLFVNLLDNALKHTCARVRISAKIENKFYVILIADDGKGIPLESQPHIFERFYRADQARSRQENSSSGSGAGLGLSISKWIAESHGGNLNLVKSDADGSIFSVGIPAENKQ